MYIYLFLYLLLSFINSLLKLYFFFIYRDILIYYKRAVDTLWVFEENRAMMGIHYTHVLYEGHI